MVDVVLRVGVHCGRVEGVGSIRSPHVRSNRARVVRIGEVERKDQRYESNPVVLQLNFERLWIRERENALSPAVDYLNRGGSTGWAQLYCRVSGGRSASVYGSTRRVSNRPVGGAVMDQCQSDVDLTRIKFNSKDIFDEIVRYSKGTVRSTYLGEFTSDFIQQGDYLWVVLGVDIYRGQTMGLFRSRDSFSKHDDTIFQISIKLHALLPQVISCTIG